MESSSGRQQWRAAVAGRSGEQQRRLTSVESGSGRQQWRAPVAGSSGEQQSLTAVDGDRRLQSVTGITPATSRGSADGQPLLAIAGSRIFRRSLPAGAEGCGWRLWLPALADSSHRQRWLRQSLQRSLRAVTAGNAGSSQFRQLATAVTAGTARKPFPGIGNSPRPTMTYRSGPPWERD